MTSQRYIVCGNALRGEAARPIGLLSFWEYNKITRAIRAASQGVFQLFVVDNSPVLSTVYANWVISRSGKIWHK
jgi:hypothetical protein